MKNELIALLTTKCAENGEDASLIAEGIERVAFAPEMTMLDFVKAVGKSFAVSEQNTPVAQFWMYRAYLYARTATDTRTLAERAADADRAAAADWADQYANR